MTALAYRKQFAFNAICPYYTMFPIEYPLRIIKKYGKVRGAIMDPFCGRGTTVYAARTLGIESIGLDTSPIAACIARAKLASASVDEIIELGERLIAKKPRHVPTTPFFRRAFSATTLRELCSLREGLLAERRPSNASALLRAAALGCLHGPVLIADDVPSYFSNQMPRTFSSKPDYSLRFWRDRELYPPEASVLNVIKKKLARISDLATSSASPLWNVRCMDARKERSYRGLPKASLTITSPPYYGMRTYVQDQWLRMWFLGGRETVEYKNSRQISHTGHETFIQDLAKVWNNVRKQSHKDAHLYIRFGTLPSAKSDARAIVKASLQAAGGWDLVSVRNARSSSSGKRQADHMGSDSTAADEFDFHAVRH